MTQRKIIILNASALDAGNLEIGYSPNVPVDREVVGLWYEGRKIGTGVVTKRNETGHSYSVSELTLFEISESELT